MTFWNKICGLIAIFFLISLFSSAQTPDIRHNSNTLPSNPLTVSSLSFVYKNDGLIKKQPVQVIPQNYYTQHFGVMCRQELILEKATKIPFRFRLGSLQQCNYYEGKK